MTTKEATLHPPGKYACPDCSAKSETFIETLGATHRCPKTMKARALVYVEQKKEEGTP